MSIEEPSGRLDLPETRTVMSLTIEQLHGGREWIREHKDTRVSDVPLWVLISLGIMAVEDEEKKEGRLRKMTFDGTVFKLYKNWVEIGKTYNLPDESLTPEIFGGTVIVNSIRRSLSEDKKE